MTGTTVALVGATGGAGTTRLTVELAAGLARTGEHVAVLDAAFATQGLGDYLDGRLTPDATALVTDDAGAPLEDGLVSMELGTEGRVDCLAANAPFERLARAKTAEAARRFEGRIGEAAETFETVLVDTPPVAANQAVAAVNATDRTALVTPASSRGADAVQRLRSRIDDVGGDVDAVLTTQGTLPVGDVAVPTFGEPAVADAPVVLTDDGVAAAVGAVASELLGRSVELGGGGGVFGSVGDFVR